MSDKGLYGSNLGKNMVIASIAELFGTFILVFAGTLVATEASLVLPIAGSPVDSLAVGIAFGFGLLILVNIIGEISGCHVNPAVTLALALTGNFPWKYTLAYITCQFSGAIIASTAVWYFLGNEAKSKAMLAVTQPAHSVSAFSVFGIEFIFTALLLMAICAVAVDDAEPGAAGTTIGFALALCVLCAGAISGGAINPARALGPMIVTGKYTDVIEYMLGPISGAMAGALFYTQILAKAKNPSEVEAEEPSEAEEK